MASVFDTEVNLDVNDDSQVYAWFEVDDVEYGWHPAEDERNPRGGSPVIYWKADDLQQPRETGSSSPAAPHIAARCVSTPIDRSANSSTPSAPSSDSAAPKHRSTLASFGSAVATNVQPARGAGRPTR